MTTLDPRGLEAKLRKRAAECATATAADDKDRYMNVVARLTREDGALMLEAADLIASQPALAEKAARIAELEAERDAARFAERNGKSLAEDSIHAIRELLKAHDVPVAAFIDDHVGNAIAQRDASRAECEGLRADVRQASELLAGPLVGAEWKRACHDFIATADAALSQKETGDADR